MKYNTDHNLEPSCYLWLDHALIEENQGFANYSGNFNKNNNSKAAGLYSYSAPHRQFVYDNTVSGVNVPSGVFVGGVFNSTGAGLKIDFQRGQALFTGNQNQTVSGRYSFKEVNLYFTNSSEQTVLFENKFVQNPRNSPSFTGFAAEDIVYPCIFIKSSAGSNKTISFDEMVATTNPVRLIFLADNNYLYRAVTSILRDKIETFMAIFNSEETPFNEFYGLKTGVFDYSHAVSTIQEDQSRLAYIREVSISDFNDKTNSLIGPHVFGGFIDLKLELLRFPRA